MAETWAGTKIDTLKFNLTINDLNADIEYYTFTFENGLAISSWREHHFTRITNMLDSSTFTLNYFLDLDNNDILQSAEKNLNRVIDFQLYK